MKILFKLLFFLINFHVINKCDYFIIIRKQHVTKDIFACLFSIHNRVSLSCHEQVCLSELRFERYFSHHQAMMGEVSLET